MVKERLLLNINHVIAIFDDQQYYDDHVYDIDYDTNPSGVLFRMVYYLHLGCRLFYLQYLGTMNYLM